jgi:NAD(P)-dependent dehydrogenase (short-subunit alcohol dehydrogenase family)
MSMPDFSLAGRVALITGAGRGIGLAIGRALASAGCAVAIQDVEAEVAAAEVERIRQTGARAVALGGDVCDLALPGRLVNQVVDELGGLHILINNAAIQSTKHWLEFAPEEIERQWRANLLAPMMLCQRAAPIFKRQRWGRIIHLGSIQGKWGNPHMMPYAISKAGIENMCLAMAKDLAGDNITVNVIAPGWFHTFRNRDRFQTPEDLSGTGRLIPAGRVGEPADAAGLALVLCGEAGSYITGQTIYVDGGMGVKFW